MKAIKLKIQGVLVLFCLVSFQLSAQLPTQIRWSNHTFLLNGSELTVHQRTNFANSCLPLDSVWWQRYANTIELDLLFDGLGAGPTIGCVRVDTITDTITPCDPCRLIVNCHEVTVDSTWAVDTAWFSDSDTSYFSYLSGSRYKTTSDFEIYPNPVSGFLFIKGEMQSCASVLLIDVSGRKVKVFAANSRELNLEGVKPGVYFLIVEMEDGRKLVKKIVVD